MPELPEVETIVRSLQPHLVGRTLDGAPAADRRVLRGGRNRLAALPGRVVRSVDRIGKYIRIVLIPFRGCFNTGTQIECATGGLSASPVNAESKTLADKPPVAHPPLQEGPLILTIHLGMAGRLLVTPGRSPVQKHTYFRLGLAAGESPKLPNAKNPTPNARCPMPNPYSELRFINPRWCMGGVWVHSPGGRNDPAGSLGPDPLTISAADFAALLSRRRQIKALLLDQTVLAGMGNIYCDEALFAASIHPRAIAGTLSPARRHRLWSAMRDRLAEAIRRGGSSIRDYRDANGQAGWFQLSLAAYGRTGEPCPACATPIAHCTAAGRSTHFCPRCQVLAGPVKARVKRPFDVPGVKTKVRTADILAAVREVRSRATRRSR